MAGLTINDLQKKASHNNRTDIAVIVADPAKRKDLQELLAQRDTQIDSYFAGTISAEVLHIALESFVADVRELLGEALAAQYFDAFLREA